MAAKQKEVKQFVKQVDAGKYEGWRAEPTSDGYQLKYEDGVGIVTIHKTPSSSRWLRHTETAMRRVEREAEARIKGAATSEEG